MRNLYIIFTLFFSSFCLAQDATFNTINSRQLITGSDTFYLVDIIAFSKSGFKMGSGQLYINYDTTAFGQNVFLNNKFEILTSDSSAILNKKIGAPPFLFNFYGDFFVNDNTASRISFSWQHDFTGGCMTQSNIDFYTGLLFTLKLKYKLGKTQSPANVCFESGDNFIHQIFTTCGPNNCNTNDCLNFPGIQLQTDVYSCSPDCRIVYATANDGLGSLRAALLCSAEGDTILFAPNMKNDTIQLANSVITLDKNINILPCPEINVKINGSNLSKVFEVNPSKNVVIQSLYIFAGMNTDCSGILNNGNLTLRNATIRAQQNISTSSLVKNNASLNIDGIVRLIGQ
jgi:hypothetical protein